MSSTSGHHSKIQNRLHEEKQCPCGHDRHHYAVSAEGQYSAWGWFCNLFGITATPKKVIYRCRHCQTAFDESTDPVDLKIQA